MSEEIKIVGFDRLNRPVRVGDEIIDQLGVKYKVTNGGGDCYDRAADRYLQFEDLGGVEIVNYAPIEKKAPFRLNKMERRGGKVNLSGLVPVARIAKSAGYKGRGSSDILRAAGICVEKNKDGANCVKVEDRERAVDVLKAADLDKKKEAIRAGAAAAREGIIASPAPRVEFLKMDATDALAALTTEELVAELIRRGYAVNLSRKS